MVPYSKYLFVWFVSPFRHFLLSDFFFFHMFYWEKKKIFLCISPHSEASLPPFHSIRAPYKKKNKCVCVLWGVEIQIHLWCWNVLWYVVETIEAE